MSMSTHVIGFKPPDAKWKKMKEVWDACDKAGVEAPKEVSEFFNWEAPDENGVEVELDAAEWSDEGREGYEIEVSKLPKGVTVIRFYNSW